MGTQGAEEELSRALARVRAGDGLLVWPPELTGKVEFDRTGWLEIEKRLLEVLPARVSNVYRAKLLDLFQTSTLCAGIAIGPPEALFRRVFFSNFSTDPRENEELALRCWVRLMESDPTFMPTVLGYCMSVASRYRQARFRPLVLEELESYLPAVLSVEMRSQAFGDLAAFAFLNCSDSGIEGVATPLMTNAKPWHPIGDFFDRLTGLYLAEYRQAETLRTLTQAAERGVLGHVYDLFEVFRKLGLTREGEAFLSALLPEYQRRGCDMGSLPFSLERLGRFDHDERFRPRPQKKDPASRMEMTLYRSDAGRVGIGQ